MLMRLAIPDGLGRSIKRMASQLLMLEVAN